MSQEINKKILIYKWHFLNNVLWKQVLKGERLTITFPLQPYNVNKHLFSRCHWQPLSSILILFSQVMIWYVVMGIKNTSIPQTLMSDCSFGWGYRISRLHFSREIRPHLPKSVLDMTLNNLMESFQECRVPLRCHRSKVYSGPEW